MSEIVVTPEMMIAVRKSKCHACGRFPWQACQRPSDRACGREFYGTREAIPVIRERQMSMMWPIFYALLLGGVLMSLAVSWLWLCLAKKFGL